MPPAALLSATIATHLKQYHLTRKSNRLRVFFCRDAPTAVDYRQTVGCVGACPSGDSAAAGDAVRIHQAQPPRRLDLVAAGEGSRRRSCLSREGPGRHRSAWGRAPIPPSGRVPMAGVSRNPQGREAGCLQARTKGAACEGRQSRATWSAGNGRAGQPQAAMPVSGRTRCASVGMGARPHPPQRQGARGGHHAEPSGAGGRLSAGANEGGGVRRAAIAGDVVSGHAGGAAGRRPGRPRGGSASKCTARAQGGRCRSGRCRRR